MFYGWWLAGIGGLIIALASVPLFQGATTWFVVLEKDFSWSKAQLSWAFALARLGVGISSPLNGYLVGKLGPRRAVQVGLLGLGAGFLLFSRVEDLWSFYLALVVMSMSAELGTWFPVTTAINNWFQRRRATAFGWSMEGVALGGMILLPVLAWAIDPARSGPDQWRGVAAGFGVAILLLALPLSMAIRNRPGDYGQLPDGDPPSSTTLTDQGSSLQTKTEEAGYSWQEAIRTRTFWLLTFGNACGGALFAAMAVHVGPLLHAEGISLTTVGIVLGLRTGLQAVFIPVGGYVGDRFQMHKAVFVFSLVQSVSVIFLLLAHTPAVAFLHAALMGIGHGGRVPSTSSMRGAYFGRKDFSMILGLSFMPISFSMSAAPLFAGYMFDATNSYNVSFTVVAVLNVIGGFAYLLMGRPKPPPTRPAPIQVSNG